MQRHGDTQSLTCHLLQSSNIADCIDMLYTVSSGVGFQVVHPKYCVRGSAVTDMEVKEPLLLSTAAFYLDRSLCYVWDCAPQMLCTGFCCHWAVGEGAFAAYCSKLHVLQWTCLAPHGCVQHMHAMPRCATQHVRLAHSGKLIHIVPGSSLSSYA